MMPCRLFTKVFLRLIAPLSHPSKLKFAKLVVGCRFGNTEHPGSAAAAYLANLCGDLQS